MKLETYTLNLIITIFCSFGFGAILTIVATRKKTKAETQLFTTEMYSTMLGDLRAQITMLVSQIDNQGKQILNLQTKESQYLKIINDHQKKERELTTRVKELESKLEQLQSQIS